MLVKRSLVRYSLAGIACLATFTAAYASDPPQAAPATPTGNHTTTAHAVVTPELKKDLADMYQKMADCLRSDKTFEQCKHEAKENCPVVKKTGHCPINEGSEAVMGKGMKHPMPGMDKGQMSPKKDSAAPSGER